MKLNQFLGLVAIAGAGYAAYRLLKGTALSLEQKLSRQIAACRPTGCAMLNGNYKIIKTPSLDDAFYKTSDRASIQAKIQQIKATYGTIVRLVSTITNVPVDLLYSFIFIESAGNPVAINGSAIGLMQLSPAGASDMLFLENKRGRLQPAEKALLRQQMGSARFDRLTSMKYMGDGVHVTPNDLGQPTFNILAGAIYLGILLDEHIEGEYVRMDKVVARYNRGYFAKNLEGDYDNFYLSQNTTTRNYILKLVGTNGLIDILTT
jgi:soluble lytic murein transglycosylase-like protein